MNVRQPFERLGRTAATWAAVLACMLFATTARPGLAVVQGDAELLHLIAAGYTANLSSIRTWEGSATVRDFTAGRGFDERWITSHVAFAYDSASGARRWNWNVQEDRWMTAGRSGMDPAPYFTNGMLKNGAYFRFGPFRPGSMKGRPSLAIRAEADAQVASLSDDFDPLYYLQAGGHDVGKLLTECYKHADSPDLEMRVRKAGALVIVEGHPGDSAVRYTYDISEGCNLVAYHIETSGGTDGQTWDWKYEYENRGGTYVPKRVRFSSEATRQENKEVTRREVEFSNDVVNEPLSPDVFGLKALGVQPGDRVYDARVLGGYEYSSTGDLHELGDLLVIGEATSMPSSDTDRESQGALDDGAMAAHAYEVPSGKSGPFASGLSRKCS